MSQAIVTEYPKNKFLSKGIYNIHIQYSQSLEESWPIQRISPGSGHQAREVISSLWPRNFFTTELVSNILTRRITPVRYLKKIII